MRTLVIEDDYASLKVAQKLFEPYGTCAIAAGGTDGIAAFISAHTKTEPFDLIVLDIMLPDKDGQMVLKEIRQWESAQGILGNDGVKIVMLTALSDNKNILEAFRSQCEGYLVKPIDRNKVIAILQEIGYLR